MPCRLAKRNHFIYAGTLVNRVFRRRCACKCFTGGGAIPGGIVGRNGVLICPRQNSGLRNRNMPVTGIVINTGGVESIVSQPIDSEELPIAFAERTLIEQLSFTAVPGEFMGIIGTSGSGKSSLIKALSNSSHCYTGTVKLNNVDITPISEDDIQSCLAYHSGNILGKIT